MRTRYKYTTTAMLAALLMAALLGAGCAGTGAAKQGGSARDVITRADILAATASFSSAYDVVQRLQPTWLRKRAQRINANDVQQEMEGDIVVYVNASRVGGPEALRNIAAESVAEIRYLDTAQATRLGTGHQHGAIMVRTL